MVRIAKIMVVLGLLVLCGPAWAVEPNLVSHWRFDDGNGTTAYDSAGDNNGTIYGAQWTTGQVNGALDFDGVNDYVDLGNDNSLKPSLPISFSTWIKLSEVGVNNIILVTDNQATNDGLWLFVNTNNKIMISFGDGKGGASPAYRRSKLSSSALSADIWYHVVAVVKGAEDMDIYINGTDDEGSYSGSGDSLAYGSGNARIGMQDTGIYFNGIIDDVRIYNRALSAEEIEQLYWAGFSPSERAVMAIAGAIDEKLQALEKIDAALEKEWLAYDALDELLASGDYEGLSKRDIVKAKQGIHSAMQHQEQSIDTLEKSIEKLEDALAALGWQPEPEPNLPEPNGLAADGEVEGYEELICTVPNLVGMCGEVCGPIIAAGFVCYITYEFHDTVSAGCVISQSLAPGSEPGCDTILDISVSKGQTCFKTTAPEFNDWLAIGEPNCWCCHRHCRGDADCQQQFGTFWVLSNDLLIFIGAYGKDDASLPPGGECANFDHKMQFGTFQVLSDDLAIIANWYGQPVPCCDLNEDCVLEEADKYNFWTNPL